jgi:FkbM family methyltransferase
MKKIKLIINYLLSFIGFKLIKISIHNDPKLQIALFLKNKNIEMVFDVGANIGQFGKDLRKYGYQNNIVSFEPLPSAHDQLMKISEKDIRWQIHRRTAIGDVNGTVLVNESLNSFSSSILEITTEHTDIEISSKYINQISSPICKFDSVYRYYLQSPSQPFFLKIDVQGFEDKVLNGASEAINEAVGILVELSSVELYAGQKLFNEMIEYFKDHKYEIWSINQGFTNEITGFVLQYDVIFVRKTKP